MDLLSNLNIWGGGWTGWFVPFIFALSVVVFFHELGHFLVARWCGVRVLVFSIGFGPELIGFDDRHGTRWKISAIPLGGYVKFFGDDNAASVPDQETIGRMTEAERRDSFFHKPVAARAAIVAAGPIANFILAILIFGALAFFMGRQVTVPRIDAVTPGSAAAAAGFKPGDVILSADGKTVDGFGDVQRIAAFNAGHPLAFVVDRGGERVTLTATPQERSERDRFGNLQRLGVLDISGPIMPARIAAVLPGSAAAAAGFQPEDRVRKIDGKPVNTFLDLREVVAANPERELEFEIERGGGTVVLRGTPSVHMEKDASGATQRIGQLGISGGYDPADTRFIQYGVLGALKSGVSESWFVVDDTIGYLVKIIRGRASADQLGGPIRIAQVAGQVATSGFTPILRFVALISVSIGLLNLFPIPLLDGGHLLFYAIEAVRGRPLSDRAQEYGFRFGLAVVLLLMLFATYNDLLHIRSLFSL
ncbi:MAG TPA: RIP metalloprotease RseP [Xanthobacteraceae bacterium]|nr:RIP metalloprotease RseP [Xanthobacteraceae bacterium]